MEWLVAFIASWVLFFLQVDWKELKLNVWSGLLAVAMEIIIDYHKINHGDYLIMNKLVPMGELSFLFTFGPVFVAGIMGSQLHPFKRQYIVIHVLVGIAGYSFLEYMLVLRGAVKYLDWHFYDSIIVNTFAIMGISWFPIVVLNKKIKQK